MVKEKFQEKLQVLVRGSMVPTPLPPPIIDHHTSSQGDFIKRSQSEDPNHLSRAIRGEGGISWVSNDAQHKSKLTTSPSLINLTEGKAAEGKDGISSSHISSLLQTRFKDSMWRVMGGKESQSSEGCPSKPYVSLSPLGPTPLNPSKCQDSSQRVNMDKLNHPTLAMAAVKGKASISSSASLLATTNLSDHDLEKDPVKAGQSLLASRFIKVSQGYAKLSTVYEAASNSGRIAWNDVSQPLIASNIDSKEGGNSVLLVGSKLAIVDTPDDGCGGRTESQDVDEEDSNIVSLARSLSNLAVKRIKSMRRGTRYSMPGDNLLDQLGFNEAFDQGDEEGMPVRMKIDLDPSASKIVAPEDSEWNQIIKGLGQGQASFGATASAIVQMKKTTRQSDPGESLYKYSLAFDLFYSCLKILVVLDSRAKAALFKRMFPSNSSLGPQTNLSFQDPLSPSLALPPSSPMKATLEADGYASEDEFLYQAHVPLLALINPLYASALTRGRAGTEIQSKPNEPSPTQQRLAKEELGHQTIDVYQGGVDGFEIDYDEALLQGDEAV